MSSRIVLSVLALTLLTTSACSGPNSESPTCSPPAAFDKPVPTKNVIVCHQPGRFCGWPANCGAWIWQNEILVGFHQADYAFKDCGHSIAGNGKSLLARSLDAGQTRMVAEIGN